MLTVELDEDEARKDAGEEVNVKDERHLPVERRSNQWKNNRGYSILVEK